MQFLAPYLSSVGAIILVVLGLGLIIFLHELGHFLMAKKNKVRVEIFSLGFGQAIFKFKWGETEYRVAWLPLGGYVKMAGETLMDERRGEPYELTSKSPWQRFQIFTAGALMNLIIAFPIGILSYLVGKYETSNEVGRPGVAETYGGMKPGDVILEVDGRKIESLDKFRIEMIRRQNGTIVPVKVRRADGAEAVLNIQTMSSPFHQTQPSTTSLVGVRPDSPAARAGLQRNDEVTAIDGKRVFSFKDVDALLRASPGKEVHLNLRRRGAAFDDVPVEAKLAFSDKEWHVIPQDDNLREAIIGQIANGMPAFGLLEPGDVVTKVNGRPILSWLDLRQAVEPNPNTPLEFEVLREGEKSKTVTIRPAYWDSGLGAIGINPRQTNVFANVIEGSYFHRAGVRSGDKLVWIDGQGGALTLDGKDKVPGIFDRSDKPRTIKIKVDRKEVKEAVEITLKSEPVVEADLAAAGLETGSRGLLALHDSRPYRKRTFADAVAAGLYEPYDVAIMTFEVLKKLVTGGESAKGLSGPIGIIHVSYRSADLSFGNFLWLLCLITVNLGIFNLLPIPVLDGGHNVLLAIEVVRRWMGKPPPSEKFVAAFQYAGLVFILALFLFVTYNDFSRLFGGG